MNLWFQFEKISFNLQEPKTPRPNICVASGGLTDRGSMGTWTQWLPLVHGFCGVARCRGIECGSCHSSLHLHLWGGLEAKYPSWLHLKTGQCYFVKCWHISLFDRNVTPAVSFIHVRHYPSHEHPARTNNAFVCFLSEPSCAKWRGSVGQWDLPFRRRWKWPFTSHRPRRRRACRNWKKRSRMHWATRLSATHPPLRHAKRLVNVINRLIAGYDPVNWWY